MNRSYQVWQEVLAEEFFGRQHAGHPTLFYVDDDVERALRRDHGMEEPLAGCVGGLLRLGTAEPYSVLEDYRWRRRQQDKDGVPAFLPLLACSVMAASRMVNDRNHRATAYHARFSELLTGDEKLLASQHYEPVSRMWQVLASWQYGQEGARGLCTIPAPADLPSNRSMVGFAQSQALLSGTDRSLMPRFFRSLREYGTTWPLSGETLLAQIEIRGMEQHFSKNFRNALREEEFRPFLAKLVGNYAAAWDGSDELVPTGAARAELLVRLDAGRLGWVARLRSPERKERIGLKHGTALKQLGDTAYYEVTGLPAPSADTLTRGIRCDGDNLVLSRPASSVLVLARNDVLGVWVSTDGFRPGEAHVVLAAPTAQRDVQRLLDKAATTGRSADTGKLSWVPRGWSLHKPVTFGDTVTLRRALEEAQGTVGLLQPPVQSKLRLVGGLKLAPSLDPHLYLRGGEPQVVLPDAVQSAGTLLVDGKRRPELREAVTAGRPVPLTVLRLEPGRHTVSCGGVEIGFATADRAVVEPKTTKVCGFPVEDGRASPSPLLLGEDTLLTGITGADCTCAAPQGVEADMELCHRDADEVLFAAADGRLWKLESPEQPDWWVERLPDTPAPLRFETVFHGIGGWLLERRGGRWKGRPVSPGTPKPGSAGNPRAWVRAVLDAQQASAGPSWAAYVQAAKELDR
ncbi:hypothetical protein M4914_22050 [Streptomyces somaliensis DSM 40738]|uniref:Uncharacterized protein n=1 Tax=Streptomyces somaliensis (strain ATCC 33201 / DSM 40738 / JCM 12659 / KCTC 9044 / NCTC 11332 / NRRL B-12077 / IP 733) TaxID=1134445 RepID=A0AA44ICU1_STRE0|nr:hypothetical protein [Streptomyces somaliensis]MCQ0025351.1 hypothetical protein [Streptomyces somaliensis DSM 40738]NKY13553.1 hypothetical protein [Streptomyces somaliensis DSM 40738]